MCITILSGNLCRNFSQLSRLLKCLLVFCKCLRRRLYITGFLSKPIIVGLYKAPSSGCIAWIWDWRSFSESKQQSIKNWKVKSRIYKTAKSPILTYTEETRLQTSKTKNTGNNITESGALNSWQDTWIEKGAWILEICAKLGKECLLSFI